MIDPPDNADRSFATEHDLRRAVITYLRGFPSSYVHKVHGHPMQDRGMLDIVFGWRGKTVWIELKSPPPGGGELTALQSVELGCIRRSGNEALVVSSLRGLYDELVRIYGA